MTETTLLADQQLTLPGPQSAYFLERQEKYESNARTYPRRIPIAIRRAHGSYIEDVDGNVYIDFLTGAGVLLLGHSHPEIVAAVSAQLETYVHGLDFPTPVKDEFTSRQLGMLPAGLRDRMKLHFCGPTGANGVEAAIKLCKTATGRSEVISFQGGFHGSTAAAMTLSGELASKRRLQHTVPGTHFFPYSYCARCPLGLTPGNCDTNCAAYLERTLKDSHGGVSRPAAVILELIQGEGGGIPATTEFARRVREITRDLDIPLIVDEVQTGCGRTGTWFAFEQYGIEPDVIIASKALSGIGLPIAVLMYDRRLDSWDPGAHIGTFRGNQLAFAAAVKTIEVIGRDRVLDNVIWRGRQVEDRLRAMAARSGWIADVRGRGLMWAIEFADPDTGAPAPRIAREVQRGALSNGLIVEVGGRDDCVIRLLPPLNVTADVVEAACDALASAVLRAGQQPGGPQGM
jgi:diaminobutyrate-2-oxoglutarate transaminase